MEENDGSTGVVFRAGGIGKPESHSWDICICHLWVPPALIILIVRSLSNGSYQQSRSGIGLGWIFQVGFVDSRLPGPPLGTSGN